MLTIFISVLMATTYFMDVKAYNIVLKLPSINETENLTLTEDYYIENRNSTNADITTDYFYIDFPRIGYQIFKNKMTEAMEMYESFMKKNPVIIKVDRKISSNNETVNLTVLNNNITENGYEIFSNMQQKPETNTESPLVVNSMEIYENTVQDFLEPSNITETHSNFSFNVSDTSERNKTAINATNNEEYTATSHYINNTTSSVGENSITNNEEYINDSYNTNNVTYSVANITSVEVNITTNNKENQIIHNQENKNVSSETNKTISTGEKQPTQAPDGFFGKVSNTVSNIFHSLTSWF